MIERYGRGKHRPKKRIRGRVEAARAEREDRGKSAFNFEAAVAAPIIAGPFAALGLVQVPFQVEGEVSIASGDIFDNAGSWRERNRPCRKRSAFTTESAIAAR